MSSLSKLKKNAENYRLDNIYKNMTPEQYRTGVRRAVEIATKDMANEYDKTLKKMQEKSDMRVAESVRYAMDTISVELLYELGNQLGCFEENAEYLDQKIDKVQDIFKNTMSAIEKYTTYKKTGQAKKEFEEKQRKVEKMFNIKF